MKEKFRFKKEMGQNFISDPALIERLAEAAQVTREDGVLEIGPGRGALTCALARRCRRLIAVELDRTLLDGLETTLALYPNAEVVEGDILRADLPALVARLGVPCRVAANLPYNITTPVVEKLLRARLPFASLAIMVQKEVGDKMTAGPGEAGYGPFSLLVQYFAEAREVLRVDASYFTPRPRVDSSFMLLAPREAPPVAVRDEAMAPANDSRVVCHAAQNAAEQRDGRFFPLPSDGAGRAGKRRRPAGRAGRAGEPGTIRAPGGCAQRRVTTASSGLRFFGRGAPVSAA